MRRDRQPFCLLAGPAPPKSLMDSLARFAGSESPSGYPGVLGVELVPMLAVSLPRSRVQQPSLARTVGHVLVVGPEEQVIGVNAHPIVACVADIEFVGKVSLPESVSKPVDAMTLPLDVDLSVPKRHLGASPLPAAIIGVDELGADAPLDVRLRGLPRDGAANVLLGQYERMHHR